MIILKGPIYNPLPPHDILPNARGSPHLPQSPDPCTKTDQNYEFRSELGNLVGNVNFVRIVQFAWNCKIEL